MVRPLASSTISDKFGPQVTVPPPVMVELASALDISTGVPVRLPNWIPLAGRRMRLPRVRGVPLADGGAVLRHDQVRSLHQPVSTPFDFRDKALIVNSLRSAVPLGMDPSR